MIEGNVLKVGGIELEIDPSSLSKTDDIVKRLDSEMIERLAEGYAVKIGSGHPDSAKLLMVRSHVQNDWFVAAKGGIPDMVQKNHKQRTDVTEAPATAGSAATTGSAPKRERKPAVPSKWTIPDLAEDQKAELAKRRGQSKIVADALGRLGKPSTNQEIADEILKVGAYPAKTGDVAGSALYHLKQLKSLGFVEEIPQTETETAAA